MSARSRLWPRRERPDGFIVVAVLWILAALAALATVYAIYVNNSATALSVYDDQLQGQALVTAGIELAAYQLTMNTEKPAARGNLSFRLGRANVAVEFSSEAGRIDLNFASKELLSGLFSSLGVRRDAADKLAERVVGWRTPATPGQDPEGSDYRTAGLKYPPRGGRFPHVEELSLVLGFPPELVEQVVPLLTVYSGQPEVNVLAAEPKVLAALPGMTPDRLYAILAQRQVARPDPQAIRALLGPTQSFATTESNNRANRVHVRLQFDNGTQMSSEVVILILDDGVEPYRILSWHDELEQIPAGIVRKAGLR